jgi:desulfoferrodoxin-like iron-binding protein
MRLSNCTRSGFDIKDPEQVADCLHGAQEALYCDKKPFTEKSFPGARGGFSCHNETFDYKPIAALHDVHMYVDGETEVSVGVGMFSHDKKTFHPMEANHYITTILLISTDPGVGPGHRVIGMKQFDPAKDKVPEAKFHDLPHTRVRALAHCNLHGAWATETTSVVPGGGR